MAQGMPGVVVPRAAASRRSTGHGRWAADLGKRGVRRWFGEYRPPSPAAFARQKGHHPGDMEKKAFTPHSCIPLLPSGCGIGALSFEFTPSIALQMERPGLCRAPPAGPAGSMADPAQCGRCALPPSSLLEALPPLAAAGRSCQSGSGSHGGRE